jgi:hypothetical protein
VLIEPAKGRRFDKIFPAFSKEEGSQVFLSPLTLEMDAFEKPDGFGGNTRTGKAKQCKSKNKNLWKPFNFPVQKVLLSIRLK